MPVTIKVDGEEKELTDEEVQALSDGQADTTQKLQSVAAVKAAAEKYGLSPEAYVQHAEGSFAISSKAIDEGLIDAEGNVIKKKVEEGTPPGETLPGKPTAGLSDEDRAALKTLATVNKGLKDVSERITGLEDGQASMMKGRVVRDLRKLHPNLTAEDSARIIDTALRDKTKDVWEHGKDFSEAKKAGDADTRREILKGVGIDADEYDENKLKEQDAGGGAGALIAGKKVSFNAKKDDPNAIKPRHASLAYFQKVLKTR
jgi:hypothetical protein